MKLTTRSRYGLRAMVVLAREYGKPIYLKDIAEHEGMSMKYLDNIIRPLKSAGLIRRKSDGYLLTRHPSDIDAFEIISLLEGDIYPVECADNSPNCHHSPQCTTRHLWKRIRDSYIEILKGTSLESLAKGGTDEIHG